MKFIVFIFIYLSLFNRAVAQDEDSIMIHFDSVFGKSKREQFEQGKIASISELEAIKDFCLQYKGAGKNILRFISMLWGSPCSLYSDSLIQEEKICIVKEHEDYSVYLQKKKFFFHVFYSRSWNIDTVRMRYQLVNISILEAPKTKIKRSNEYFTFKQIVLDSLGKKGYQKWLAGDHKTHFNKVLKICEKHCNGMNAQTILDVLGEPDFIVHYSELSYYFYNGVINMGVNTIKFCIENNKVIYAEYELFH